MEYVSKCFENISSSISLRIQLFTLIFLRILKFQKI
jgi:hypothetical protein